MKVYPFNNNKIRKWIKEGKTFYCFGAGAKLRSLCNKIDGFENHIACIADNNKKLWGTYFSTPNREIIIEDTMQIIPSTPNHVVLLTTSFYKDVADQLEASGYWKDTERSYFFPHKEELHIYHFNWLYSRLKIKKKIIFRSGNYHYIPGWDYTDNAKALFEYMIREGYNQDYQMIWLVHEPHDFPEINKFHNVKAISYEWPKTGNLIQKIRYFYHLRTAKYLFFTDAMYWTRFCTEEQIRVNLWHGNGFKAKKNKNGAALDAYFDYTTVSGPLYLKLHEKYLGCSINKIFDTGLAKEDLLFMPPEKGLDEILGIPKAGKYIFWLPTFRVTVQELQSLNEYEIESETGLPVLTTMARVEELNSLLRELDIFLIIKLHPVQENSVVTKLDLSNIRVLTHIDISQTSYQINNLLAVSDALISDFSSVAVDYILRDKPLAFVLEDEELYKKSRGFVFDPLKDYLPGKELYNYEDMESFFRDVANGIDPSEEKRHKMLPLMHSHQDGNSCKRILELVGLGRPGEI
ncbi:CDP-glycerol glycerophosphotransferase family protein [Mediterraneibacter agrestimuris]|uniref:CDP-glycerol glycerophosphotransferase family protein n=1 Tax=Mediterraneibacter agrestimuris TaxID=2941333 RepID=UPI00203E57C8|nr:CDP-glycerol glycerophosphotransferase family protein [Mediterraneibacter agrestimuris]